jgi:hypothetical protein
MMRVDRTRRVVAELVGTAMPWRDAGAYILAQVGGAVLGVWASHAMFAERILMLSNHARTGPAQMFSEFVATFGLLAVIWGCSRRRSTTVPFAVAAYITAAYWFTVTRLRWSPVRYHSCCSTRLSETGTSQTGRPAASSVVTY